MAGAAGGVMILVCGIALFGYFAALLFYRILGWYLDGDISGSQFVIFSTFFFAALILIFLAPFMLKVLIFLMMVGAIVGLPYIQRKFLSVRDLRIFQNEKIEQYRAAIALRPDNVAARQMLAEELWNTGNVDEAIEAYQEVVRLSPSVDHSNRLAKMMKEREELALVMRPCPNCGHRNPAKQPTCSRCGGSTSFAKSLTQAFNPDDLKRIVKLTAIVMAILAIPLFIFSQLSLPYRIFVVCVIILVFLIAVLVRIFRPE